MKPPQPASAHPDPSACEVAEQVRDAASTFNELFATLHVDCLRLAWQLTSNRTDAEDIASDVLASAWGRIERGEINDMRAYLLRAVTYRSRSWLQRRYVRLRKRPLLRAEDRGVRWHETDVADRDQIWRALQHLPYRQRAAIVLRYYEDLSVAQAAEILGVREGTVKSNTSRGLDRLAQLLTPSGPDQGADQ